MEREAKNSKSSSQHHHRSRLVRTSSCVGNARVLHILPSPSPVMMLRVVFSTHPRVRVKCIKYIIRIRTRQTKVRVGRAFRMHYRYVYCLRHGSATLSEPPNVPLVHASHVSRQCFEIQPYTIVYVVFSIRRTVFSCLPRLVGP